MAMFFACCNLRSWPEASRFPQNAFGLFTNSVLFFYQISFGFFTKTILVFLPNSVWFFYQLGFGKKTKFPMKLRFRRMYWRFVPYKQILGYFTKSRETHNLFRFLEMYWTIRPINLIFGFFTNCFGFFTKCQFPTVRPDTLVLEGAPFNGGGWG